MELNKEVVMNRIRRINSLPTAGFKQVARFKRRPRREKSEFQRALDSFLAEWPEEVDEADAHSFQLPLHGAFWDDGTTDVRLAGGE